MVVYFTGTGNSRYCAQVIADDLNDEIVDSFHFIREGISAELTSQRPWIFVAPTYGWRLPRIFQNFIRSGVFQGSSDAYFVMTCGSEISNAGVRIEALCKEVGLHYKGVSQVVMPENYIALFDVPEKEEARSIIDRALPGLKADIAKIAVGECLPTLNVGAIDRLKTSLVNPLFYRFVIKASPFYATDQCIGCGKCAKDCVLGNITLKDGKPVWGNACTHCMACICGCPKEAIEYGKNSRRKPRYQCMRVIDSSK